jgi:putative nucleotidyltransferase with HDIG domain
MPKTQILFVDDDLNVLDGLRRALHTQRDEWDMHFAASGPEALELMASRPIDMLVSDMRMSPMNGAELLQSVMERYPSAIRIILSGYADSELIMKSVGVTHQFISKPCDPEILKSILNQTIGLKSLLSNKYVKEIVSNLDSLPSLPSQYSELEDELRSPDTSIKKIGGIISKDPAMTAKILQLVNSAFFGLRKNISNTADAVMYLGVDRIQHLFLAVHAFTQFKAPASSDFSIERLWEHCISTAAMAKRIAEQEDASREIVNASFTAGLLHDIGKLMLSCRLSEKYADAVRIARSDLIPLYQAEQQVLSATHAEIGAYLLGIWGLPGAVVEATAFHHRPKDAPSKDFCALTALHAADFQINDNNYSGVIAAMPDRQYLVPLLKNTRIPEDSDVSFPSSAYKTEIGQPGC